MADHTLGHGTCPACQEDTNRSMLELVDLRAQVARLGAAIRAKDAALEEHGGFHAPKDCGDRHRPRPRLAGTGKTCFYCEPALSPDAGKGCEHEWEVDTSIPVQDFGRYGVRFGACRKCGVGGNTDGITGKWKPKRALNALKGVE